MARQRKRSSRTKRNKDYRLELFRVNILVVLIGFINYLIFRNIVNSNPLLIAEKLSGGVIVTTLYTKPYLLFNTITVVLALISFYFTVVPYYFNSKTSKVTVKEFAEGILNTLIVLLLLYFFYLNYGV